MARKRGLPLPLLLLVAVGLPAAGMWWYFQNQAADTTSEVPLSDPIQRGPMQVTVLEAGSLEALESHVIRSQVEGRNAILFIVPEGRVITPEEAASDEPPILVQLDDAGLKERIAKQELEVRSANNSKITAENNLAIQKQTNASEIRKGKLAVRFAELDLTRYVGDVLDEVLLQMASAKEGGIEGPDLAAALRELLDDERLRGEALQRRRTLLSDIRLAEEELSRAQVKLDWSQKLNEKGYASREELDADRLSVERRKIDLERAQTALQQFANYDFPKEAERLLSELVDKRDQLSRTIKKADNNLAKAQNDANNRKEQAQLQVAQLQRYKDQIQKCVIRADRPGMIVYASSGRERGWRDDDRIQEGTTVRQRQALLRIPKPGSLGAHINIHESVIDRMRTELRARIVVDAMPDRELEGRVIRVATLPNATNRWLNPDLKVYATVIEIDGVHPQLKPGMSVQVEVLLDEIDDALQVPIQAVAGSINEPLVYVWNGERAEPQPVKVGLTNDQYAEIKEGLAPGVRVLLTPPRDRLERDEDGKPSDASRQGRAE